MVVGGGALLVFFGVSVLGRTVSLPLSRAIGPAKKAPDASTAAALAAVRGIATKYSGTTVMDQAAFKTARAKPIQQMLMLVYALLALAILIALLGIGNTLALSIFERTRELGVMRAVGMTRQQLRAMIRWESVIIALQGTVLGLLIGVFFGWALVLAMKNQGITVFSIPVLSLAIVVVLAALAGVTAAILPSRRAAKLNILVSDDVERSRRSSTARFSAAGWSFPET